MLQQRVYSGLDAPMVEVLDPKDDTTWRPGVLRMWIQNDDRTWVAQVAWTRKRLETFIDNFPADHVRLADSPET